MLQGSVLSRAPPATDAAAAMKAKRPASPGREEEEAERRARGKRLQGLVVAAAAGEEGAETRGLRLLTLLLRCAEAVAADHLTEARDLLPEIAELASPFGSSPERVAAYFGDALCARVLSSCLGAYSPLASSSSSLRACQSRRVAGAFQAYNALSPLVKFAHFTANQAILQALDAGGGEDRLHVIDLDIMQGLQWPGLFHILASRRRKPRSLRVTGLGASLDVLEATGRRLADFAASLGLPFEFRPIEGKVADAAALLGGGGGPRDHHLHGETTVVHWMHHCLYDVTGSDAGTVRLLRTLRPKLITIVEQDLGHSGDFLGRFVEALHYYSALFDALGDGAGDGATEEAAAAAAERHAVERQLLGAEIRNIVAVGGPKRTGEVRVERWSDELRRAGFRPVSLAGSPATQARLLLGMHPLKGYTLVEEDWCLKLGWKDLSLLTASAWAPADDAAAARHDSHES